MGNGSFHFGIGPQWQGTWHPGQIEPSRRLYDFELVFFSAGCARVVTEAGTRECRKGDVAIIPPGMLHTSVALTLVERRCVHFTWYDDCPLPVVPFEAHWVFEDSAKAWRPDLAARVPQTAGLHFPCFRRPAEGKLSWLLDEYFAVEEHSLATSLLKRGLLSQLLGVVLSEPAPAVETNGAISARLLAVKNEVDTHYLEPTVSVAKLAAHYRMSPNYLSYQFHITFGLSIKGYLLQLRLNRARELLRSPGLSIREVAFQSGFNDANYFARLFHKKYSTTPKQSRR